jgi:hypothetical protein
VWVGDKVLGYSPLNRILLLLFYFVSLLCYELSLNGPTKANHKMSRLPTSLEPSSFFFYKIHFHPFKFEVCPTSNMNNFI